jgi:uncharacterized RDD family membrane protein YckC
VDDENDTLDSGPLGFVSEPGDDTSGVAPIAGFWRRLLAFLIDSIMLGIVGQALGWSLSSVLFEVGPYGRIVGQVIGILYFGVMGSRIAGGSTLGKRLLGLAVRGPDGRPIGIVRSLVRTSVWVIPLTLNGWALPILSNPVVSWVATVLVFGVGGAMVVTMLFNRSTRQGLHDILTQTYVLRIGAPPVQALPTPGRLPWVLSAAMLAFAVVLASVGRQLVSRAVPQFQDLVTLQHGLQKDDRFFSAGVFDNTFHRSDGAKSRTLRVQVWYKGVPTEATRIKVMNEVARAALSTGDPEKFDLIRIEIVSAYDLGIASGRVNHGDSQPVSVWKQRVDRDQS